jgi:hypothetical protein
MKNSSGTELLQPVSRVVSSDNSFVLKHRWEESRVTMIDSSDSKTGKGKGLQS